MEYVKINHEELSALRGLPHLQQLLYLVGIKPYIDYNTGIVGLRRGISYQSLSEELYVEPHPGIKSGSPSKDQIRRALKGLETAGLLRIQSMEWKLVFHCLLVTLNQSHQNKAALKQHDDPASVAHYESPFKSRVTEDFPEKATTIQNDKPAIPQKDNNIYLCVYKQFEKFWSLYPQKNSKQKALEAFQALQPTDELLEHMLTALQQQIDASHSFQAQGLWSPKWKFPANWLAQHCWEDEINTDVNNGVNHATHPTYSAKQPTVDLFWESCKSGAEPSSRNRVIQ